MKKTYGLSLNQKSIMSILEYKRFELIRRKELIDLIKKYKISKNPEFLIKSLLKKNRIISIKRGIYLIVPLSAINEEIGIDDYKTNEYILDGSPYYIGLYNAFNFHHFTEQIPNILFVFNTKYSGMKRIMNMRFRYYKIKKERLFGILKKYKYPYSDKEKTIIDVLNYPEYLGGLSKIFLRLKNSKYNKERLVSYAIKYKSVKVMKLVGYLTKSKRIYDLLKKRGKLSYYTTVKMTKLKIIDKKWKIRLI
jgi:predicted transcriptional regulator of viral defense system